MPPNRKDIEAGVIARFEDVASHALTKAEGWTICKGMRASNRIAPSSWNLKSTQQFQFGDLRVELHDRTVVIETESAGGETNLVKYWSFVEELTKPLALIHLFGIMSENDYISHRMLWSFLGNYPVDVPRLRRINYGGLLCRGEKLAIPSYVNARFV